MGGDVMANVIFFISMAIEFRSIQTDAEKIVSSTDLNVHIKNSGNLGNGLTEIYLNSLRLSDAYMRW